MISDGMGISFRDFLLRDELGLKQKTFFFPFPFLDHDFLLFYLPKNLELSLALIPLIDYTVNASRLDLTVVAILYQSGRVRLSIDRRREGDVRGVCVPSPCDDGVDELAMVEMFGDGSEWRRWWYFPSARANPRSVGVSVGGLAQRLTS